MSKITIIGDVHGKTNQYQKMLRQKYAGQRTIQIGDMGIGFKGTPGLHKDIMGDNHKWFRGNHDDPEKCRASVGYLGDFGFLPEDDLFWIAGAHSIDYAWRIPGKTWWAEEELSWTQLDAALDLFIKRKPRFVISHEAPQNAAFWMLTAVVPGFRPEKMVQTRTGSAMQRMLDYHRPEKWIFGHYHIDKTFNFQGVEFTCVNELSTYLLLTNESIVE
jgi:predicted phosphohydrolase